MARKYHKTVDYLILAAELVAKNRPIAASKALIKAATQPGAAKALAELDQEQQAAQDAEMSKETEATSEQAKTARALAKALSLSAEEIKADGFEDDEDGDDDEDMEESSEGEETADEVDLENVSLEVEDTDGQLMRDSAEQPAPDTTKASVLAKRIKARLSERFAAKKPAAKK